MAQALWDLVAAASQSQIPRTVKAGMREVAIAGELVLKNTPPCLENSGRCTKVAGLKRRSAAGKKCWFGRVMTRV
jgi:hypothetical protein